MRVLFLVIGPEAEPSSRFRVYQFVEPLRARGVEVEVRPRVGRRYFELGYGLRRPPWPLRIAWVGGSFAWRSLRRLRDLWDARRFDVVVFQKETLPFGGARLVSLLGLCAVYDFDDAVYARPAGPDGLGRAVRWLAERVMSRQRSLPDLLSRCDSVLAGSRVLAEYAARHNDRVEILPTVVDTEAYAMRSAPVGGPARSRPRGPVKIGWIGAPANAVYLEPLRPALRELARRHPIRVVVRGTTRFDCPGVPVELRGWRHYRTREEETRDLDDLDIGIMPLPEDSFAAGKCALKAIQYMANGIPVVASPVGANVDVIEDGVTGFLARTPEEWVERLSELVVDEALRARMGRAGRARVERHYSIAAALPRLLDALGGAARRGADRGARASGKPGPPPPGAPEFRHSSV